MSRGIVEKLFIANNQLVLIKRGKDRFGLLDIFFPQGKTSIKVEMPHGSSEPVPFERGFAFQHGKHPSRTNLPLTDVALLHDAEAARYVDAIAHDIDDLGVWEDFEPEGQREYIAWIFPAPWAIIAGKGAILEKLPPS